MILLWQLKTPDRCEQKPVAHQQSILELHNFEAANQLQQTCLIEMLQPF